MSAKVVGWRQRSNLCQTGLNNRIPYFLSIDLHFELSLWFGLLLIEDINETDGSPYSQAWTISLTILISNPRRHLLRLAIGNCREITASLIEWDYFLLWISKNKNERFLRGRAARIVPSMLHIQRPRVRISYLGTERTNINAKSRNLDCSRNTNCDSKFV